MNRRDFIKNLSVAVSAAIVVPSIAARVVELPKMTYYVDYIPSRAAYQVRATCELDGSQYEIAELYDQLDDDTLANFKPKAEAAARRLIRKRGRNRA